MANKVSTEKGWEDAAGNILTGRTITGVRYMSKQECKKMGWYSRPLIIGLDDGTLLYSSADDEGNDGGALFTTSWKTPVIPVINQSLGE